MPIQGPIASKRLRGETEPDFTAKTPRATGITQSRAGNCACSTNPPVLEKRPSIHSGDGTARFQNRKETLYVRKDGSQADSAVDCRNPVWLDRLSARGSHSHGYCGWHCAG